jgi:hypothetical protein
MLAKAILMSIWRRNAKVVLVLSLIIVTTIVLSSCGGTGACVGSGGSILSSPVCKEDWTKSECQEWDDMGINGAEWDFRRGASCEGLGYTDRCSDGSYREPGEC